MNSNLKKLASCNLMYVVVCLLLVLGLHPEAKAQGDPCVVAGTYTISVPESTNSSQLSFNLPYKNMRNAQKYRVTLLSGDNPLVFPDGTQDTTGTVNSGSGKITLILQKSAGATNFVGNYCFQVEMWNTTTGCWSEPHFFKLQVVHKISIELTPTTPVCNEANNLSILGKLKNTAPGASYSYKWKAELIDIAEADKGKVTFSNGVGDSLAYPVFVDGNAVTIIGGTIANGTNKQVKVKYTVVPYMTINGITGAGEPEEKEILVNPTVTLALSAIADTICNGNAAEVTLSVNIDPLSLVSYDISVAGELGKFVVTPAGATDLVATTLTDNKWSTGNLTLNSTEKAPVTLTYTITPKVKLAGSAAVCIGDAQTYKVTIFPTPDLSLPADMTICSGDRTAILLTIGNTGGDNLISWTSSATGAVKGNSSVIGQLWNSGMQIEDLLVNNGSTPGTVTYTVNQSFKIGTMACASSVKSVIVTVNPASDMNVTIAADTICDGEKTNIAINSALSGGTKHTIAWTCVASSPDITGWTNRDGDYSDGLTIAQTLKNTGDTPGSVTYYIKQTYASAGSEICTKDTIVVITVIPEITVKITDDIKDMLVCSEDNTNGLVFESNLADSEKTNVVYRWYFQYDPAQLAVKQVDGITITDNGGKKVVSGVGNFGNYQITNISADYNVQTVVVKVSAKYLDKFCKSAEHAVNVSINPRPSFELGE